MESEYKPGSARMLVVRVCGGFLAGMTLLAVLVASIVINAFTIETGLNDSLWLPLMAYAAVFFLCASAAVIYVFEGFKEDGTWPDQADGERDDSLHDAIRVHANRIREVLLKLSPHDRANACGFLACTAICVITLMLSIYALSSGNPGQAAPGWVVIVTMLAPVSGGVAYVFSTHVRVPKEFEPYMRNPAEEARKQIRAERVAEQSRMIGTMLSATGTKRKTTESAASKL